MILSPGFLSLSPVSDGCLIQDSVNFQKRGLAIWCMWSFTSGDADTVQMVKWSFQEDVANTGLRIMGHAHADRSVASGGAAMPVPVPSWAALCPGDVTFCSATGSG